MLDAVRQIGIFMIAAQAVVHFAPGKQYEKYIKSVAGIILLLLFLKPVLRFAGAAWGDPQMLLEKWEEMTDMPDFSEEPQIAGVTDEVTDRMEAEIKEQLNRGLETDVYFVSQVSLRFQQMPGAETGTFFPQVDIVLKRREEEEAGVQIGIEDIVIGQTRKPDSDNGLSLYRRRFAVALGLEEERVEVRLDGRS